MLSRVGTHPDMTFDFVLGRETPTTKQILTQPLVGALAESVEHWPRVCEIVGS